MGVGNLVPSGVGGMGHIAVAADQIFPENDHGIVVSPGSLAAAVQIVPKFD